MAHLLKSVPRNTPPDQKGPLAKTAVHIPETVLCHDGLPPLTKLVYVILAVLSSESGGRSLHVTQSQISEYAHLCRGDVNRAYKQLAMYGYIRHSSKSGSHRAEVELL